MYYLLLLFEMGISQSIEFYYDIFLFLLDHFDNSNFLITINN